MPRSSRHKTSRSHKHGYGKERSDSEDERISKEKKPRAEEMEKRAAQASQGKEVIGSGKGIDDVPVEHAKKRKDRADDSVAGDQRAGVNEDERVVDKKGKGEGFKNAESVKAAKSSALGLDSKERSGRRGEDLSESGNRVELVKRKSEKELSRKESGSSSQYKDEERDIDYSKDAKGKARDYVRDVKEREIEYYKDGKNRGKRLKDVEMRDRDQSKDVKDRDYPKDGKERDRDQYRDAKERGKEYSKDAKEKGRVCSKDEKERDKDYPKDVKERSRDHPRDAKEFDRDYPEEMNEKDRVLSKDAEARERDYYKDAKEKEGDVGKYMKEKERDYGKDAKERDRDLGSLQDKNVQDARHEMSNNMGRRKHVSKISSSQEEHILKKDMEIADRKLQDNSCNPELEKEIDKRRRGDCFGDVRDSDEKQLSSRDDRTKNGGYKDERHRDGRSRERYRDDLDRDKKHRDERSRDEHFMRDQNSSRSDKHFRDDSRISESCYKKIKTQDNHHDDSSYVDGRGNNLKHNKAVKRTELDSMNIERTDSSLSGNQIIHSPGSRNYALKEQKRPSSKQAASSYHKSEEAFHSSTNSTGDHATVPRNHGRGSEFYSLGKKENLHLKLISDFQIETLIEPVSSVVLMLKDKG